MTAPAATLDALMTTDEVAAIFRVSPRTLRNARSTGKAGYPAWIKVGGVVRYERAAVAQFIAAQEKHREAACQRPAKRKTKSS